MTALDHDPASPIPPGLADLSQTALRPGNPVKPTTPADTRGPRIRRAGYEPMPAVAVAEVGDPRRYHPGPIIDDLPDDPAACRATRLIMLLIVEVLARRRPATHLAGSVTASVQRCVRVAAAQATHVRLSSLHMQQPHANAVEVTAVCHTATGCRAVAARIQRAGRQTWRCTVFRFL